jgi:hypothetical protein
MPSSPSRTVLFAGQAPSFPSLVPLPPWSEISHGARTSPSPQRPGTFSAHVFLPAPVLYSVLAVSVLAVDSIEAVDAVSACPRLLLTPAARVGFLHAELSVTAVLPACACSHASAACRPVCTLSSEQQSRICAAPILLSTSLATDVAACTPRIRRKPRVMDMLA